MFTSEFLDQLAEIVAAKVVARIEQHAQKQSGLSDWLDRYGPMMTRDEVSEALKISKRHLINLEDAGKVQRAAVPGKQVKYETVKIFQLATNKRQQYANQTTANHG